jgi:magnesium transporter
MSLHQLLRESDETSIMDFAEKDVVVVNPNTDPQRAALRAIKRGIREIPVVDYDGSLLGVLTGDLLMSILNQDAVKTILRFGGLSDETEHPSQLFASLQARLPWLLIGLAGGFGTAIISGYFEDVLEQSILLALFIPLMVYVADATAAQMQAYMIRDLGIQHQFKFVPYFFRQTLVVISIGSILSLILWGVSLLLYNNPPISFIISISLFLATLSSIFSGMIIPFVFSKLQLDPASASGPIGTIIQDTTTITIYFLIARSVLL